MCTEGYYDELMDSVCGRYYVNDLEGESRKFSVKPGTATIPRDPRVMRLVEPSRLFGAGCLRQWAPDTAYPPGKVLSDQHQRILLRFLVLDVKLHHSPSMKTLSIQL